MSPSPTILVDRTINTRKKRRSPSGSPGKSSRPRTEGPTGGSPARPQNHNSENPTTRCSSHNANGFEQLCSWLNYTESSPTASSSDAESAKSTHSAAESAKSAHSDAESAKSAHSNAESVAARPETKGVPTKKLLPLPFLEEIADKVEDQKLNQEDLYLFLTETARPKYRHTYNLTNLNRDARRLSKKRMKYRKSADVDIDAVKTEVMKAFQQYGYKPMGLAELRKIIGKYNPRISSVIDERFTKIFQDNEDIYYRDAKSTWSVRAAHRNSKT